MSWSCRISGTLRNASRVSLDPPGGILSSLDNDILASDSEWMRSHRGTKKWKQITRGSLFEEGNRLRDVVTAYGNQVAVDCIYCSPCLIVPIDPAPDRV